MGFLEAIGFWIAKAVAELLIGVLVIIACCLFVLWVSK